MNGRRAVITGIGPVTAIGIGLEALWDSVVAGRTGVATISRYDSSRFPVTIAAEVKNFDPATYLTPKQIHRLDRFSQFGVAAALLAQDDAHLDLSRECSESMGVYVGSALGGIAYGEEQYASFVDAGRRGLSPMLALAVYGGASAANIAIAMGLHGPSVGNATSCASGTVAVGEAVRAIRRGEVDIAFAGGIEAPISPLVMNAFALIKVLSTRNDDPARASRPFDRDRDGFVMGEGGAILVVEELDHAVARGAPIYAEVLGFGMTSDAYHMTAPRPDGAQATRSITLALADSGIHPDALDYVAAHASATVLNDPTEALALQVALGDRALTVPVSGTKGMHGHALGASGAIELAITAKAIQCGVLPWTVNLDQVDDNCALNHIVRTPLERRVDHVLKTTFGFGGVNASMVLGRVS